MYTQQQEDSARLGQPKMLCNDNKGWFRVCKDMLVFTDGSYDWVGSIVIRSWDFDNNDGLMDVIFYDGVSQIYDNAVLNKGNLKFELIKRNQPGNPMVQISVAQTNYKATAIKQLLERLK